MPCPRCTTHTSGQSPNPNVNSPIFKSKAYTLNYDDAAEENKQCIWGWDVPGAQDGEVGQVGELGQCHAHVVLHIHLVKVQIRT